MPPADPSQPTPPAPWPSMSVEGLLAAIDRRFRQRPFDGPDRRQAAAAPPPSDAAGTPPHLSSVRPTESGPDEHP